MSSIALNAETITQFLLKFRLNNQWSFYILLLSLINFICFFSVLIYVLVLQHLFYIYIIIFISYIYYFILNSRRQYSFTPSP